MPSPTGGHPPLLDWRDPSHYSRVKAPCRYCGRPTHLRDSQRRPADKVCAEEALATQAAQAADTYQIGRIT